LDDFGENDLGMHDACASGLLSTAFGPAFNRMEGYWQIGVATPSGALRPRIT
jgi:hypothetical protein